MPCIVGDQSPSILPTEVPRVSDETKQATRATLLAAAAEEFGRVGLERANIDAISLAAGFAKGTIYNYFPSKQELFLAVVEEAVAQATAAGSAPADAPARERLAATLAGFCAWAGEHDPIARVLVRECLMGTPGLYPRVIGAEAPLVGELEAILREGIARGELRDDVPADLLALAITGLTDLALVEHWASDGTRPSLEAIPELVLTLLLGPRSAAESGTNARP
jgi:AcrR family transcriptional regulator